MDYINSLINNVEDTHEGLGELIAVLQIAVTAKKMVLVVSPSGCGKSISMDLIARNTPDALTPDRLSIAGLSVIADKLTSFRSVVVVDDITTSQTPYARNATITALAALCYTHRVQSIMMGVEYTIEDFYGSALVGVQPIMLRNLMLLDEWDGSIQDKALRYYHLYRPLKPNMKPPNVEFHYGIDIDDIDDFEPDVLNKNWHKLIDLGNSQWSLARTKQHLIDMLKAIAGLEQRKNVIADDYLMLARLLKPMAVENIVVVKEQLEGERYLDNNLLALLVEYFTYGGEFPLAQISLDYKLSLSQSYKIMASQSGSWQQVSKSPTIYKPSKRLLTVLKKYELEIKNADGHSK